MQSIELLFKDQIKQSIEILSQNFALLEQDDFIHKFLILKDMKNKLSSRGQVHVSRNFPTDGISRIYRSSNKTYPLELSKVKKFFENKNLDKLTMIHLNFKSFFDSCLLSSNASYAQSTIVHPIFIDKIEEILNNKKLILSSGKFSSKSFIVYLDMNMISQIQATIDNIVTEILDQEISLDLFIKIIQDMNLEYKNQDYELKTLSHRLINNSIYSDQTIRHLRTKSLELSNTNAALKNEIVSLKKNSKQIIRQESKVTTSSALTWR